MRLIIFLAAMQLNVFDMWYSQENRFFRNWGCYVALENTNYQTILDQTITSSNFNEEYYGTINSYPSVKLGGSFVILGNLEILDLGNSLGKFKIRPCGDVQTVGLDLGAGISYSKSRLNATPEGFSNGSNFDFFDQVSPNYLTFFNYYQPGNLCLLDDYGINVHADIGSLIYFGAEIDAGPSRIRFTDSRVSGQKVRSAGWFTNAVFHVGVSFPIVIDCNRGIRLHFKFYSNVAGWCGRFYKLDWVSDDKRMKNFSTLKTVDRPVQSESIGVSLSIFFDGNKMKKQ